ncbi:ATP-binding protein [Pantanalinema sp. GBBB05]|uniref:ATP-binding protein n=1 Tax=Pantanalinema sp. GBBB05 TaxID=2604139 RepID=UPI001D4B4386|nr:response regulator [Pantanalinema sp. GBBB05]
MPLLAKQSSIVFAANEVIRAVSEDLFQESQVRALETPIEGYECLIGGGEMGRLMRSFDWSNTPFGLVEQWPQSLRSTLSICLNSRFPIAIYWGADCLLLYNDAWRPIVGDKHPWSLGRPAREVWPEIWTDIGPEFAKVLATGEGIFHSDELLAMHRFGYTEECFFDYTFNPIQGQGGVIDGILNIVSETTYRVLTDRRGRLLREVASRTGIARTVEEVCALMLTALRSAPTDIPLALLYLVDPTGRQARFYGSTELTLEPSIAPAVIELDREAAPDRWLIAQVARTARAEVLHDLVSRFGALPGSPWPESPQEALVLPIGTRLNAEGTNSLEVGKVSGVLVAVASPRRRLDDNYCDFLTQVAGQIATAIANARSYEEERQRAEQLAELDRAKTVFFSNVSHEFRTPLTLMLGPVEDALHETQDQVQRDRLELIHRNALRLQKLVNTLLDFSRIEAGRIQAVYEPTDLARLTTDLAGVFQSAIEQAGLHLRIDGPPLPDPVYVDREMWEKIVLNLLSNAFKFTFEGEIAVSLRPCGDRIELQVQDTGTGIPPEELPQIFERFHRVKGARGRSYEGSGIGLSLVQELVQLHGGSIEVSSVVDQGTCFTVSLPSGQAHLPSERIQAPRTLTSTAVGVIPYIEEARRWLPTESTEATVLRSDLAELEQSTLRRQVPASSAVRILIADDNADMRDYLRRLLSQQYTVEVVGDGMAALATIRQQMPDLLLTDVMMPGMNGFELLRSLRTDPTTQDVPIILLSARAGEEARIEGLTAGADDYLTKPFSARELLARVEASLKLKWLRQQAAQQEQALRIEVQTAKDSLERVLARIADQFLALDCDWRYTYVNDRVTEVTGMTREALLGQCLWDLFPTLVSSSFYTEVHRAVADQISVQFEYFYPEWNRWFENYVYPSADGVSIIVTEITPRKLIEAEREHLLVNERHYTSQLQGLTRAALAINSALSVEEVLTVITNQAAAIIGTHQSVTILTIDQSWTDALTTIYLSEKYAQWWDYNESPDGSGIYACVCHLNRPMRLTQAELEAHPRWQGFGKAAGQHPPLRGWLAAPLVARNGHNIGLIQLSDKCEGEFTEADESIVVQLAQMASVAVENARLYEAEQQARATAEAAREVAQAANRVKDEFLAVLSHELRSPLNPILGWSTLLLNNKLDAAKTRQALTTIQRNAKLQSELIEDLLDVSRILQGKLALNVAAVNLASIIRAAMETVRLAAEAKSIHIEANLAPEAGLVWGDATRLQQVIWNLLSNAVKFTPERGQVQIQLQPLASAVHITVSDTGQGIDPDFLPYVFDYFRQADAATTRKFGGLGLGLAIVRHLVELHGGTVEVASPGVGMGATFTVKLPLMSTQTTSPQNTPSTEPLADLQGIQVLVVDDEVDSREFITFVLEQFGAQVMTATTAAEALTCLMRSPPDILLSDIGMPDMDGYMLMQQVRRLPPEQGGQIPAIALTAYAGDFNQQRALQAGFQQHLSKPVEPEVLVETIAALMLESA